MSNEDCPLVVDLDGTLIRTDLLVESAFAALGQRPQSLFGMLGALFAGKAALKSFLARQVAIDPTLLPYDPQIIELIRAARGAGKKVYLASASNQRHVAAIAKHLGLFDGWFASDELVNLSAKAKADRLVGVFGVGGFDYIGDSSADLAVWRVARRKIAAGPSSGVEKRLLSIDADAVILAGVGRGTGLRAWLKLLRVHQWAKNFLVFLPALTAHRLDFSALDEAASAFAAFSLAASSVYILNDLIDLENDRGHPRKKFRPLAAGTVPIKRALLVGPMFFVLALAIGATLSLRFELVLLFYLLLTTAYSLYLKRKMLIDVIVLAALYTTRVIAGAEAIPLPVSEWLLGFSMFMFAALALIKRYVELAVRLDSHLPDPGNRNYRKDDLTVIAALAGAAGFNAVTVLLLYVSSDAVNQLYHHPKALWLVCPILMYWLGRALMLAHRRELHDDPVVFAMHDRKSLASAALIVLIMVAAI